MKKLDNKAMVEITGGDMCDTIGFNVAAIAIGAFMPGPAASIGWGLGVYAYCRWVA